MKTKGFIVPAILFICTILLYFWIYRTPILAPPQNNITLDKTENKSTPKAGRDIQIIASNLNIPWEIAFLPNGDVLVTERPGRLLKIGSENKLIQNINGVKHIGEGGLLGMSLHPNFSENSYIYLYSTTQDSTGISNRIERYTLKNDTLNDRLVILNGIKGSANHDGGRIAFGPDGLLYITTGDAENPNSAQDKKSLNGKILRIKDDGSIPNDNPFGNEVYSLGHRNPQGITWDENGTLWETEHGPSGLQTGNDEINIINKGSNYGWPIYKGDQNAPGFVSPILQSGNKNTWAPSGMTYFDGNIYFAGLRGEALYQFKTNYKDLPKLITQLKNEYGRLRSVTLGKDGYLYLLTNNRDGRGDPSEGDDKIIKINPDIY